MLQMQDNAPEISAGMTMEFRGGGDNITDVLAKCRSSLLCLKKKQQIKQQTD